MTSRQCFKTLLMTSALVGGICLPAFAGELTPAESAPAAQAAPAQASPAARSEATPVRAVKPVGADTPKAAVPVQHRLARAVPRSAPKVFQPGPPPRETQVAISEPAPAPSRTAFLVLIGVAY